MRFRGFRLSKNAQNTITAILVAIIIIGVYVLATYNDNHYTRTGTVSYVCPVCYELTDATGHSFGFYTTDVFKEGTIIEATLDNKGTVSYLYDDEIRDYKIVFDSQD